MTTPIFKSEEPGQAEAELFQLWLDHQFLVKAAKKDTRPGLHAANTLVPDKEWCTRRWVLNNLHNNEAVRPAVKPWEAKQEMTFDLGWAIHIMWQNFFKEIGIAVWNGEQLAYELDLTHYDEDREVFFSPDAIVNFAGQLLVIEIKGYKEEDYERLVTTPAVPDLAHRQVNFYLHLLKKSRGLVLVQNKNKSEYRIWPVTYDRELAQKPAQRATKVKGLTSVAKAHNRYPERTCQSITDPLAQKCPMKAYCFSLK
jgi:hypothetical protein